MRKQDERPTDRWRRMGQQQNSFRVYTIILNKKWLHLVFYWYFSSLVPFLPSLSSLFPGFYRAKADVVIYCGHPSLVLIHHRLVARRSWQQLFAFEFNRGAVSQRQQVKSITKVLLSHRIINQRQER